MPKQPDQALLSKQNELARLLNQAESLRKKADQVVRDKRAEQFQCR
jgi:hypothetical protein